MQSADLRDDVSLFSPSRSRGEGGQPTIKRGCWAGERGEEDGHQALDLEPRLDASTFLKSLFFPTNTHRSPLRLAPHEHEQAATGFPAVAATGRSLLQHSQLRSFTALALLAVLDRSIHS